MKAICQKCRGKDIQFTSATDKRRKMVCRTCGHQWTNGKKLSKS
jgi:protein-arginine kinase activator protein McsA